MSIIPSWIYYVIWLRVTHFFFASSSQIADNHNRVQSHYGLIRDLDLVHDIKRRSNNECDEPMLIGLL